MIHNSTFSTIDSVQAIVLAAGQGSRLKTGITKMITPICGQPMVVYTLRLLESLHMPITAVIGFQKNLVQAAIEKAQIKNLVFAEQTEQLGTGHALLAARKTWNADTILVLNGDMPLIDAHTINTLLHEHAKNNAAITVATSYNIDPANTYGRIVHENGIVKIIEKKHFTYAITDYPQVNVGVYVINRSFLEQHMQEVEQNTVTREFYITDLVEIASRHKLNVTTVSLAFDQFYGVNTFQELATVEEIKRASLIHHWMGQGVRFIAPGTVHLDHNVVIGRGTVIYPGVQLLNGTIVGEFCTLMPYVVLDRAHIEDSVTLATHSIITDERILKNTLTYHTTHFNALRSR
jgi:bifunctional UDP-N-acetylglucosamine pyrophosphorylase/glucosamine-1-phosphate N-acetyltransferase